MAELYLDTQHFLNHQWKDLLETAAEKEKKCLRVCENDVVCQEKCRRTIKELNRIAKEKQELYVRKGVEYCKSECWNTKDIKQCSERCLSEYSVLLNEFKSSLLHHFQTSSFYNN
jgi:hypothetical protein